MYEDESSVNFLSKLEGIEMKGSNWLGRVNEEHQIGLGAFAELSYC